MLHICAWIARRIGLSHLGSTDGETRAAPIRVIAVGVLVLVSVGLVFSTPVAADGPEGMTGAGTEDSPYNVTNLTQLQAINQDLTANYTLVDDINASETANWNDEGDGPLGFEPVGGSSPWFTGSFDGGGHEISGLTINRSTAEPAGLFGRIEDGATVSDVRLTDVDVLGYETVGGVAGRNRGTVSNSSVHGTVRAVNFYAGGITGNNRGSISNTSMTGDVTVVDGPIAGGIVGRNDGLITRSYTAVSVAGEYGLGGIVGANDATVADSYWDAEAASEGDADSAVGDNYDVAENLTGLTTAQMTGRAAKTNMSESLDFETRWKLTPTYPSLVPYEHDGRGTDQEPYEIGTVLELQLMANTLTANYTLVDDIDASGTENWNDGAGFEPIGEFGDDNEFMGTFDGSDYIISKLTINRSDEDAVGLFGATEADAIIENVGLEDVDIHGDSEVGGLIGENGGEVRESYVTGSVDGDGFDIGGLIGDNFGGEVNDSYATVDVYGGGYSIGGLVGNNGNGEVRRSYATGSVDGGNFNIGGLVGDNDNGGGTVEVSYWDTETTGLDESNGGTGLTTVQMTGVNASADGNMGGLDYDETWLALDDEYPVLDWQVDTYDLALADEVDVGRSTDATVDVTLSDGTQATATETSTYTADGPNVSVNRGTVTGESYGPDTVTAMAGGFSDTAAITALDSDFTVSLTDPPTHVNASETVDVAVTVENVGNDAGTKYVALDFNDTEVSNQSVSLAAGENRTITETHTVADDAATGTVDLSASSPDDASTTSVDVTGFETLYGTLIDGVSGERLSGAEVQVDGEVKNTSADNGAYEVEILNNELVELSVRTTVETPDGDATLGFEGPVAIDDTTRADLPAFAELGGEGTAKAPFEITNAYELQSVRQNRTAEYELTSDIDASGTEQWNDGAGFDPIGSRLRGSIDGGGHAIDGLTIYRPTDSFVGLVSRADDTSIQNLSVIDANVTGGDNTGILVGDSDISTVRNVSVSGTVTGGSLTGGIVGGARDESGVQATILDSEANVTVTGVDEVGGIVGQNRNSVVDGVRATGSVTGEFAVGGVVGRNDYSDALVANAASTAAVSGDDAVGGLVGDHRNGEIRTAWASGSVDGKTEVGGLVGGIEEGVVEDVYAAATVTGDQQVGGLVGLDNDRWGPSTIRDGFAYGAVDGNDSVGGAVGESQNTVSDLYWDEAETTQSESAGGATGLTTAQMTGANATADGSMDALDYDNTWLAVDDYPLLVWQVDSYDLSLADDEIDVGETTEATVDVTLDDDTRTTASEASTYTSEGNVSVDGGTVAGESYGPDTVTATNGGFSDAAAITALDSEFQVDLIDTPTSVDAGETETFNASVENVGNDEGTEYVALALNGTEFSNDSVTVAAGATEEIAVDYEIPDIETGAVDLNASTPDDEATTSVDVNGNETVSGRIIDGATGEALSNLTVTVDDGSTTYEAETNATGVYELPVINGRAVTVSASVTVDAAEGSEEITDESTTTVFGETDVSLDLWPDLAGKGTSEQPYNISTARELAAVSQDTGANYTLVDDVDASETDQWQPAKWKDSFRQSDTMGLYPIYLSGSLDGDGHTITNLTIFTDGSAAPGGYVGLFQSLASGQLSNLFVENATATESTGAYTGLVVSSVTGESRIENVRVTGTASSDGLSIGGLVGYNGGEIHNSSANVSVDGEATNIGGLVGEINLGSVNTSFAVGSVNGTGTLGGLVGNIDGGTVENSYWDVNATGQSGSAGSAIGLTTANMTGLNATRNMNLDFESTWAPTTSYPVHRFDEANAEAVFAVRSVDLPDYVAVGDMVRYNATLENVGTANGSKDLSLSMAGSTSLRSVTLAGGSTDSVTSFFNVPDDATPGTYDAVIETPDDDLTDTVDIRSRETVSGTVIDGVTGEPLSDVPVTVDYADGQRERVSTDDDGNYSIKVINGTEIALSASTTADAIGDPVLNGSAAVSVDGSETADLELWPELDGEGTETDPYNVSNAYELQAIGQDSGANYTLVDDVDASETAQWHAEAPAEERGFRPVALGGTLDGNGYAITDLTVVGENTPGGYVGLFGTLSGAHVSNLSVENASTDASGGFYTGLLAGSVYNDATIENVRITGTIDADTDRVGPIGELSGGEVRNVTADVDVNGNGTHVGGLVGKSDVLIENASATGAVGSSATDASVGGLVGRNTGAIVDTFAMGSVSGDTSASVGGLVGTHTGTLETSYATGAVADANNAGGLIGTADGGSTVSNAYWDRNTTGQSDSAGDGIGLTTAEMTGVDADETMDLGFGGPWYVTPDYPEFTAYEHAGNGTEDEPYEISSVDELQLIENDLTANYTLTRDIDANETADWNAGTGFAPIGVASDSEFSGSFDGRGHDIGGLTINNSMASGVGLFSFPEGGEMTNLTLTDVDVTGKDAVGGVAGGVYDGGVVRNVSVSGAVRGDGNVGLLQGESIESTVVDSSADGTVNGTESVGGLIGYTYESTVTRTTASGVVEGDTYVGGLVGWNSNYEYSSGVIESSSSSAAVTATATSGGGLVGQNDDANVTDSYATGSVTGGDAVGGLVGTSISRGNVSTSYATGAVDGNSSEGGLIGEIVGTNGAIVDAYWNTETTGQQRSAGSPDAAGLTTKQMQAFGPQVTMPGFFEGSETWIVTGEYPALAWQDREALTVDTLTAADTASTAGESGTITVTATAEGVDIGEGVTVEVVDNSSLDGLDSGSTAMTDANGTVGFEFNETAGADYEPTFEWTDDGAINDTATVTIGASNATTATVTTRPTESTVGDAIAGPPAATVTDAFGNPVDGVDVTVSTASGEPFAAGTTTQSTDSAGVATFDDLTIETAESYRLQFGIDGFDDSVDSDDTVQTDAFDVLEADADRLTVVSAPETITAGEPVTLTVRLTDEFGNPAVNQSLDGLDVGSEFDGTVFESASVRLNETGGYELTIPRGALRTANDSHSLTVDADGVHQDSLDIAVDPAAVDGLAFVTQPDTTAAGATISNESGPLVVVLHDTYDNVVDDATDEVTLSATTGSGSLTGETTVPATDGRAEFSELSIRTADAYKLQAVADGLIAAESDRFGITPATVDSVSLDPAAGRTLAAGETVGFNATAVDAFGNVIETTATAFEWQNTTESGVFEETATGTYTVTAEYGAVTADPVAVTVTTAEMSTVSIDPDTDRTITAGDDLEFSATARDTYGNVIDDDSRFSWTNTTATGVFESTTAGTYTVKATIQQHSSDPVVVTVEPGAAATLAAPNVTETAGVGGSLRVTATDAAGNPVDDELIAVSDTGGLAGLTINETNRTAADGVTSFEFTDNSSGLYTVDFETAADASVTTTTTVRIERAPVDTLSVSLAEGSLTTGESTRLTAVATFSNGTSRDVTGPANLTANDSAVATVDANGTVTAEGSGQTNLSATFDGVTEIVPVSVSQPSSVSNGGSSGGSSRPSPPPTPPVPSSPEPVVDTEPSTNGSETAVSVEDAVAGTPVSIRRADGEPLSRSGTTSVDELSITTDTDRDFSATVRSTDRLDTDNPEGAVDLSLETDGSTPVGYLSIDHDLDSEITTATITFSVEIDGDEADNVRLYRNVDGEWTPLDTRLVGQADGRAQYEATTPGFSVFAVGVDEPTDTAGATDTDEPTDLETTSDDTPGFGLLTGLLALLSVALLGRRHRTHR
jgi:PGF-CTERM protein